MFYWRNVTQNDYIYVLKLFPTIQSLISTFPHNKSYLLNKMGILRNFCELYTEKVLLGGVSLLESRPKDNFE